MRRPRPRSTDDASRPLAVRSVLTTVFDTSNAMGRGLFTRIGGRNVLRLAQNPSVKQLYDRFEQARAV